MTITQLLSLGAKPLLEGQAGLLRHSISADYTCERAAAITISSPVLKGPCSACSIPALRQACLATSLFTPLHQHGPKLEEGKMRGDGQRPRLFQCSQHREGAKHRGAPRWPLPAVSISLRGEGSADPWRGHSRADNPQGQSTGSSMLQNGRWKQPPLLGGLLLPLPQQPRTTQLPPGKF